MKCANCKSEALFEYRITHDKSIFYCGKHLPKFLEARKRADLIAVTDSFAQAKSEALDTLSEPAPIVEEPAPKPKKKAAKKKAE